MKTALATITRKLFLSLLVPALFLAYIAVSDVYQSHLPMDKAPFVYWCGLDPHREVFISWETTEKTASYLRYGTDAEHLDRILRDDTPATLHRLHLTGLAPNTRYYYQAGPVSPASSDRLFDTRRFQTAPDTKEAFNVTFTADSQEIYGAGAYNTVASAVNRLSDTAFVVNAGDLTQFSDDQPLWNLFFRESIFLDRFPLVPCPGNHDDIDNPDSKYLKYFGVTANDRDVYYAFDWGNARFIIAQIANRSHPDNPRNKAAYRWIEETLAASQDRDYRILIYHINHSSIMAPLVEKYNVSLAIHGHEHTYRRYTINQHTYVCLGSSATPQAGIIQKVANVQKRTNGSGFTRLTINPVGIRLETLTPTMDTMDDVFLRRDPDTGRMISEEPTTHRQEK